MYEDVHRRGCIARGCVRMFNCLQGGGVRRPTQFLAGKLCSLFYGAYPATEGGGGGGAWAVPCHGAAT